jgi:uncharacterized membrane protein HdeD (DUF308 family)
MTWNYHTNGGQLLCYLSDSEMFWRWCITLGITGVFTLSNVGNSKIQRTLRFGNWLCFRRMPSSEMWRCVSLVRNDFSGERVASIFSVERISELWTSLSVTSKLYTYIYTFRVRTDVHTWPYFTHGAVNTMMYCLLLLIFNSDILEELISFYYTILAYIKNNNIMMFISWSSVLVLLHSNRSINAMIIWLYQLSKV